MHWKRFLQGLRQKLTTHCVLCTLPREKHLTKAAITSPLCMGCRTEWSLIHKQVRWRCQRCKVALLSGEIPQGLDCDACLKRPLALTQLAVALDYSSPVDSLVWRFKGVLQLRLAPQLAALMIEAIQAEGWQLPTNTWVVAIPSRRQALRQRGFNPAAELARYVAQGLGLRWQASALVLTQPESLDGQKHRSLDQRWLYAQRAFQWCASTTPTAVLVVDDVLTTGSTLHGAALCLQAQGVQQVYGVALARTPWLRK